MSIFYVLPSRPVFGRRLADFLKTWLPDIDCRGRAGADLAETLAAALVPPDVFVVYREDLPEGEETGAALLAGFGAEPGDQVVEIVPGQGPAGVLARRWALAGDAAA